MTQRKYVYVVGAGASCEFGFPAGTQLTKEISGYLRLGTDQFGNVKSGDTRILGAFDRIPPPEDGARRNRSYLSRVANDIAENMGLALSIDNYLEAKKKEEAAPELGKIGIARALLRNERKSKLWFDEQKGQSPRPRFADFPENWLTNLFQILTRARGLDQFLGALSSHYFVTFNYDRVIEQFFYCATKSYFSLDERQARDCITKHLNVVHVYGSLGDIMGPNVVSFGNEDHSQYIFEASQNIHTFSEGVRAGTEINRAKRWLQESNVISFLGFSFLPLNVRALKPERPLSEKRVFGTCHGLSADNLGIAKNILAKTWFRDDVPDMDFRPVYCAKLISDLSGFFGEDDLD
ncbi:hypothetical protein [Vannielia sp.]|uniref:hypothetical protein n=1 Tax=Vannielia sp. TaxID=2813045 RepID=UPI002617499C|nr:hypothetical protein [Vannielia sp.]MDF1871506.1 hypothetical protein [Vannielia sp.]